jgi:hypothetical protein
MAKPAKGPDPKLEKVPANEPALIDSIASLTVQQLERRYTGKQALRGVHPKDHGCVEATLTISDSLPPELRVGLFRKAGASYRAAIRFSNAAPLVAPDSLDRGPDGKPVVAHGSRGMAIKVYDVEGPRLVPDDGERTQDFLMINQPVFAFANVEDYEALSRVLVEDKDDARRFFGRVQSPDPAVSGRAKRTFGIIQRVKATSFPPAFQPPPMSPLDNRYFTAAPFLFGPGRAAKFAVTPVNPRMDPPAPVNEPDYLRAAMRRRMAEADGKDICFDFQVQVRSADNLAGTLDSDIEDACVLWDEAVYPFVTVARLTIGPQDITSPERQEFCEKLFYTPWHGLQDHQPLGGINRMRHQVYEASGGHRGCPVSPNLPPPPRREASFDSKARGFSLRDRNERPR